MSDIYETDGQKLLELLCDAHDGIKNGFVSAKSKKLLLGRLDVLIEEIKEVNHDMSASD